MQSKNTAAVLDTDNGISMRRQPETPQTSDIGELRTTILDSTLKLSTRYHAIHTLKAISLTDSAEASAARRVLIENVRHVNGIFSLEVLRWLGKRELGDLGADGGSVVHILLEILSDSKEDEIFRYEAAATLGRLVERESFEEARVREQPPPYAEKEGVGNEKEKEGLEQNERLFATTASQVRTVRMAMEAIKKDTKHPLLVREICEVVLEQWNWLSEERKLRALGSNVGLQKTSEWGKWSFMATMKTVRPLILE